MSALKKVELGVTFAQIVCGSCGGVYAITERYREQREKKCESWTCPYCNTGWGYSNHKTEAQLEKERHQQTLVRLNEEKAAREELERKLQRVGKGVCPECKRSFRDLERHMACKHGQEPRA